VNRVHNLICSSRWWARQVRDELLPFGLDGVDLGDDVLEIGPGFGATTRLLARAVGGALTAVELEPHYCTRLRSELGDRVDIVQGDATQLPFDDERFSAAVCFTMLHHIPERELQNRAFSEIARVLRPGGLFAGTDSVGDGVVFKLIHVGDNLLLIDPDELPTRLRAAGLADPVVKRGQRSFRFRAHRPA
jgi:ubiquinone/menaquinone biosynthesis C-methylase UbiE